MVSRDAVIASLETIHDPHVPVSLRRMGMLDEVTVDEGAVTVCITVPCLGCPAADLLKAQVRQQVGALQGVTHVHVDAQWGAGWRRQHIDPQVHPLLRQYGLQL